MIMELSKEQNLAVNFLKGPAFVLAVPGAGKTSILILRTHNLINMGIDPKKILTITFSKKSQIDMEKKYIELFNDKRAKFSTIHSFCFRILRYNSKLNSKPLKILEGQKISKSTILKNIYYEFNKTGVNEENLEKLLSNISYIKNLLLNPHDFAKENKNLCKNFLNIYLAYEKYKSDKGLIDFDDMLTKTYELLLKDKKILKKVQDSFSYIQIDEGQDTSLVQYKIIDLVGKPHNNIFLVADDDQSIYGFRGAKISELFKFKDKNNPQVFMLEENYRSTKNIINASSSFIAKNKKRFDKKIIATRDYQKPVHLIKVKNRHEQFKLIASFLKGKSNAILYRNNISAISLIEFLEKNKIPFNIKEGKNTFFNSTILFDLLNILNFSRDTGNLNLLKSFYYKIKGYISKNMINFLKYTKAPNLFEELLNYPNLPNYYKDNFHELIIDFKVLKNKKIYDALIFILNDLKYLEFLKRSSENFGMAYRDALEYLDTILYCAKNLDSLEEFLGRLRHLQYLIKKPQTSEDSVFLSTIHGAKGLEFENVFLIDLIQGNIPSSASLEALENMSSEAYEEERRLFYVGLTRAKNDLYLFYPKYYLDKEIEISEFFSEMENL